MTTRSERLKESRLKAGLSQKQVADAVGMKQPSYSYLEKNDNASSSLLPEIARILNVDPLWLRTGFLRLLFIFCFFENFLSIFINNLYLKI